MRLVALVIVIALALAAMFLRARPAPAALDAPAPLTYVTTANQRGVVGYRDPAGALSPDGRFVAYAEGRDLRVVPIAGGASAIFPRAEGQVRWVTWLDDGRVLADDGGSETRWWVYGVSGATRAPLWSAQGSVATEGSAGSPPGGPRANDLRQPVASLDGVWIAATVAARDGVQLWRLAADGMRAEQVAHGDRPSSPAWMPNHEVACIVMAAGRPRIAAPCGASPIVPMPDIDAVGPIAVAPDGAHIYLASPNERGFVDLWRLERATGRATRLTAFARDAYAPSIARNAQVLIRTQSYRTVVAEWKDGQTRQLTSFQAETPWWHPAKPWLSVTYGTWRRVIDDAKYPDIAQEVGVVDADAGLQDEPTQVIANSDSEDQGMAWSPNGRWIALHSHREQSDDVWLRPTGGGTPDRRITMLGRGAEVGWPRWSPDGRTLLLDGANTDGRSVAYTIGVNQETGEVTSPIQELATPGLTGDVMHAEWMPDGARVAFVARDGPGRHVLAIVPAAGGPAAIVHRFETEHDFPGVTVSADGRQLGFVAPAPDGYYQVFRIPVSGGLPEQITRDPSHKTQPAWSPDGSRLAYTVWSYTSTFWLLR
jgi:dipeptidyl aminopeptidase/acylaminoacyl peptidase